MMMQDVRIVEVAPRDGLQNEAKTLSPLVRAQFIQHLVEAGLTSVEVGSFVSPKWVPQMAGCESTLAALQDIRGAQFSVLVPNETGLEAAIKAGVKDVAIFAAASEAFSQKNINCSIAQSFERFAPVVARALEAGILVRGYISCVLGCPYQGEVPLRDVVSVAERLHEMGCYELSLGDTVGVGTPTKARALIRAVQQSVPVERLAAHFHDTFGQALANLYGVLEEGVRVVDSSAGGLGGCPYARGAAGNVATEAVVYMLEGMGLRTGVDMSKLLDAVTFIYDQLGKSPRSNVYQAMAA